MVGMGEQCAGKTQVFLLQVATADGNELVDAAKGFCIAFALLLGRPVVL